MKHILLSKLSKLTLTLLSSNCLQTTILDLPFQAHVMVPLIVKWVEWHAGEAKASFKGRLKKKGFQSCYSSLRCPMKPEAIVREIERAPRCSAKKGNCSKSLHRPCIFLANLKIQRAWSYKILVLIMEVEVCCIHGCFQLLNSFSIWENSHFKT